MTRPAYDMVVQGMGGIMSVTGHPGTPPTRIGVSIGDIRSCLYTAVGLLSALYHRAMTGEATKVDIGMFACQLALLETSATRSFTSAKAPGPLAARPPSITPFEASENRAASCIVTTRNP